MGSFTTILHPEDGRGLQIKCGYDVCETFKVGDNVNQHPSQYAPEQGYLLDDVYPSYSGNGDDDWVIIKDGIVAAVRSKDIEYNDLYAEYNIQPPPREWWPEELWSEKEARDIKSKKEAEEFRASIEHLSFEQQFAQMMIRPLMRNVNYSSLKDLVSVEPLDNQGALSSLLKWANAIKKKND